MRVIETNDHSREPLVQRRLTAILSADVKGCGRLMGTDEVATIRTLKAHREIMAALIRRYHGRVIDSPGDNLLVEFVSVVGAVQCAVDIQQTLKLKNAELPIERRMEFRIGVNLGDVIVEGDASMATASILPLGWKTWRMGEACVFPASYTIKWKQNCRLTMLTSENGR